MVGNIPQSVEWTICYACHQSISNSHIGHVRLMGLRSNDIRCPVVATAVATVLGDVHIAAKEMVPVVIALALWGKRWQGCTVLCQSDNNGSGGCVENRVSQGQAADAPAALSAFLHSSCPTMMHCGYPHPREVKHGGRCHFT